MARGKKKRTNPRRVVPTNATIDVQIMRRRIWNGSGADLLSTGAAAFFAAAGAAGLAAAGFSAAGAAGLAAAAGFSAGALSAALAAAGFSAASAALSAVFVAAGFSVATGFSAAAGFCAGTSLTSLSLSTVSTVSAVGFSLSLIWRSPYSLYQSAGRIGTHFNLSSLVRSDEGLLEHLQANSTPRVNMIRSGE